ncbi:GNAT family N-acetyltransferase [Paenibacillus lycopersici]|uniref:GNAT family N-acetyltransferase n=1 Tax=Paenibacillus lycopersici TaxID=2704462 RepID=UPI001CDC49E1|nr:GNAT family N-acetyltransferase [Paenibacillus lycopersici]
MQQAGIRYEQYREQDYKAVSDLLLLDAHTGENILRVLAEAPELFVTAYRGDTLVGVAQVNEPGTQSYLTVFVTPQFRRQGIGSAMLEHAETQLRSGGTRKVRSSFRAGHLSALAFAHKHGYSSYFSSALMQRVGDPFPLDELPVRPYRDEDYFASQSLYAEAFHDMRVRVGRFPDSVVAEPSEEERSAWKADADTRYVYEVNGGDRRLQPLGQQWN